MFKNWFKKQEDAVEPAAADLELTLSVEPETAEEPHHTIEDLADEPWDADSVDELEEDVPQKAGFFKRLVSGLEKTRKGIGDKLDNIINRYDEVDDDLLEELEEALITADVGMPTTLKLMESLKEALVEQKIKDTSQVKTVLGKVMESYLCSLDETQIHTPAQTIILVIGVNGAGKTTTIGKLAHQLQLKGQSVLVAAADTFRAAAIDQLKIWGERAGVEVIAQSEGSDPAAVVFDAVQAAKSRKTDVLICDTAGRLHNKKNLMNELEKINRIITREFPEAHQEVLLVLDATTGQNAIQQAKLFKEVADISGIVLTKLDGTAKGGVVLAIYQELKIPVKLIGVGEGINDLQRFHPHEFTAALLDQEL